MTVISGTSKLRKLLTFQFSPTRCVYQTNNKRKKERKGVIAAAESWGERETRSYRRLTRRSQPR